MSASTTTPCPNPTHTLLPGFEIRPLNSTHLPWIKAIITHSNLFANPIWATVLAHRNRTALAYQMFAASDYVVNHALASGLSYGVFDTAYAYKRAGSAATGGALYWDGEDGAASGADLLAGMDFPLVSVALAYDGWHAMDAARLGAVDLLPAFGAVLRALDERDAATWTPTAPGQLVCRNSTSTRADYMGRGLMRATAVALMRAAREEGFRAVRIECFNEVLPRVWAKPPAPFRGKVVSSVHTTEVEVVGEGGEKRYPLREADQMCARVWVDLV